MRVLIALMLAVIRDEAVLKVLETVAVRVTRGDDEALDEVEEVTFDDTVSKIEIVPTAEEDMLGEEDTEEDTDTRDEVVDVDDTDADAVGERERGAVKVSDMYPEALRV